MGGRIFLFLQMILYLFARKLLYLLNETFIILLHEYNTYFSSLENIAWVLYSVVNHLEVVDLKFKFLFGSIWIFMLLVFFPIQILAYDFETYGAYEDDDIYLKAEKEEPIRPYEAASVLVMDVETGAILYHTDGFSRRYPASVTKVMTALLVLEAIDNLDEIVTFSRHAISIPSYASRMGMREGDTLTVREALYGLMLPSGNEVARALAEHVAGSVPAFIQQMNQRAVELGAHNTRFVNACGLPGNGQFITAYDLALIMREAIQHPAFVEIIGTAYFDLLINVDVGNEDDEEVEPVILRNTNRMVRPTDEAFNEYIIGGKTGFTNAAQHTLVSYARRGEHSIIISILFAPRGATFTDTAFLMEYVFAALMGLDFETDDFIALAPVTLPPRPEPPEPPEPPLGIPSWATVADNALGSEDDEDIEFDDEDEFDELEHSIIGNNGNNETVPAFSLADDIQWGVPTDVQPVSYSDEVTNFEAVTVASGALSMVAVLLGGIYFVQKKTKKVK